MDPDNFRPLSIKWVPGKLMKSIFKEKPNQYIEKMFDNEKSE